MIKLPVKPFIFHYQKQRLQRRTSQTGGHQDQDDQAGHAIPDSDGTRRQPERHGSIRGSSLGGQTSIRDCSTNQERQ